MAYARSASPFHKRPCMAEVGWAYAIRPYANRRDTPTRGGAPPPPVASASPAKATRPVPTTRPVMYDRGVGCAAPRRAGERIGGAMTALQTTTAAQDLRPVQIDGLFETHLTVSNLARAVAFYRDVLGLPLAHTV